MLLKLLPAFLILTALSLRADERPNIVWIIPDDMSANFSCYGETTIKTPNVDALAAKGVKFTHAYVTAPVCSPCRSAFITGMYQTSIGAHHHRSGRGAEKIRLPEGIKLIPKLFKEAGYHTSITGWPPQKGKLGKTDYNFEWDPAVYDGSDWSERQEGQPFFVQIQTPGGKLRGKDANGWEKISRAAERKLGSRTPVESVKLPPYYPNHPDIIRDWAAYLDSVRMTDVMVGEVLARLDREGVRENTLVIFMTDHGISHARGKQFMYDEGLHVPLVMSGPGMDAGTVRGDLVEHIDIAALSLAAAKIALPDHMQSKDILANGYTPREAVFAARDRCDETIDHMRSVRTADFKYIRNFLPNRPYLQPCGYKDAKSILMALREWNAAGKLDATQKLLFRDTRPREELYDLKADPHEIRNLADDPGYVDKLTEMRDRLSVWMEVSDDKGRQPEPTKMYDSDMSVYLDTLTRKGEAEHLQKVRENIVLNKRWAAEERIVGAWAMRLHNGDAGWLSIDKTGDQWKGEFWSVGQPKQLTELFLDDDTLSFTRHCRVGEPKFSGGPPTGERFPCIHRATVVGGGDALRVEMQVGPADATVVHEGKRMPPLPPKPDLSQVRFGEPVQLLIRPTNICNFDDIGGLEVA